MKDEGQGPQPGPGDPETSSERRSGLALEACYRHPRNLTGVHCTRCGRPICPDCMTPAPVGYQCPECASSGRAVPSRRVSLTLGTPGYVTRVLLVVNVFMFVVELATGGQRSLAAGPSLRKLFELGALYPPAIARGHQYWRLISAMFLHAGLLHLALNMYGLYLFGFLIERAFGSVRFLAIYLVTGFLASVTSFVFADPQSVAVGASGAIFGLLGAWVAFNLRRRGTDFASANLRWALMLIGINLVLGFSIAGIDNFAHMGGLAAGVVAGSVAEGFGPRPVRVLVQIVGFAALALAGIALTVFRVSALS